MTDINYETKYKLLKDFVKQIMELDEVLEELTEESKMLYGSGSGPVPYSHNMLTALTHHDLQIKIAKNNLRMQETYREQSKLRNIMKAFVQTDDLILAKLQGE
jgi:hypothetical protein